jgi:hypothetical protein
MALAMEARTQLACARLSGSVQIPAVRSSEIICTAAVPCVLDRNVQIDVPMIREENQFSFL